MKPEELIAIVKDRGFKLYLKDGVPCLRGPREDITGPLMDCLKANRKELIAYLEAAEARKAEVAF